MFGSETEIGCTVPAITMEEELVSAMVNKILFFMIHLVEVVN